MNSYHLDFNPDLLSTFLVVSDLGRISAAAQVLHLSQPAITARIRNLEAALGVPLLIRSAQGVQLTAAGQKFYDRARKIHALIEESVLELRQKKELRGRLGLAASTTVAAHLLPKLLSEFRLRYRDVSVSLTVGNTEEILKRVSKGEIPLGLVEGHARAALLRLEPFVEDEIVLVAVPALAGKLRRASDIFEYPLIGRERGSGTRAVVERALKKKGLKNLRYVAEMESSEAIKAAVAAGMGLAFISRWAIGNELALGKLIVIALSDLKIARLFYWALPSGGLSGLAFDFYRFARERVPLGGKSPHKNI